MMTRNGILITFAWLCHGLLASLLLTIQLRAQAPAAATVRPAAGDAPALAQAAPSAPGLKSTSATARQGEPVTLSSREQEKHGDLYRLRGDVEIEFRKYVLRADEVTYNDATGEITATGHVSLDGGPFDEHMTASHGTYNVNNDSGRFWDVYGTTGVKLRGRNVTLTSSNPFTFRGAVVEKVGRDKIIVHHGVVTECSMPRPQWKFSAGKVTVVPGDDAKIYHGTFWLWRIPVLYFPFFDHPVERLGRKTGLLMPSIGNSTSKGTILGGGVFWAINRSMDATVEASYLSKRGPSEHVDYYARPNDNTYIGAHYYGVQDREHEGGYEFLLNGTTQFGQHVRGVADIDYLSAYIYRQEFSDTFRQAANAEVRSSVFVTGNSNGYSLNLVGKRYQNFLQSDPGDVITIFRAPTFEASSADRPLGKLKLAWGFDSSAGYLTRNEPDFTLGAERAGRFDLSPHLSLPLQWQGWSLRSDAALRETWYSNSVLPGGATGQTAGDPFNRSALETQVQLRAPDISRIFERPVFGNTLKHSIEAWLTYRNVTGVNDFSRVLRFDQRDILTDTSEMEYGFVQRLYAKRGTHCGTDRADKNCEGAAAREILSWEVSQKYFFDPFFGGALVPGRINVFQSTVDFTGIAFLTEPRNWSPIVSRLRWHAPKLDTEWRLDYDSVAGRISSSIVFLSYRLPHDLTFGANNAFLQIPAALVSKLPNPETQPGCTPPPGGNSSVNANLVACPAAKYNQFGLSLGYGHPNKRGLSAAVASQYDANSNTVQYTAVQTTYNWDCCGVVFEYRRLFTSPVRNDHEYRFALTLANVGTFGTLRKQERLY